MMRPAPCASEGPTTSSGLCCVTWNSSWVSNKELHIFSLHWAPQRCSQSWLKCVLSKVSLLGEIQWAYIMSHSPEGDPLVTSESLYSTFVFLTSQLLWGRLSKQSLWHCMIPGDTINFMKMTLKSKIQFQNLIAISINNFVLKYNFQVQVCFLIVLRHWA